MKRLRRLYYIGTGLFSWLVFGLVGIALNIVCMPLLLLPRRERFGPPVRVLIHRLFRSWQAWLHFTRIACLAWEGFTPAALAGPAVYIANHPGLLDATFLLGRLPDTICIFKRALIRNPAIGPAAIMAGYGAGDKGIDLIGDVAARVAAGRSLLVFPEGTRSPPREKIGLLKPGFALIAARAGVPVRLIAIDAPRSFLPRGEPWWRVPPLPVRITFTLIAELRPAPGERAAALTARAQALLAAALPPPRW